MRETQPQVATLGAHADADTRADAFARRGAFSRGFFEIVREGTPDGPVVIVVPGFLSASEFDPPGPLENIDPRSDALRNWQAAAIQIAGGNATIKVFHWAGAAEKRDLTWIARRLVGWGLAIVAGFDLPIALALAGVDVYKFHSLWSVALTASDDSALDLGWEAEQACGRTVLLGHSLGGRMVMKATAALAESAARPVASVALAPAITADDLDWDQWHRGVERRADAVFSANDWVLWVAFRLGQFSLRPAVGYEGPPDPFRTFGVDVSTVELRNHAVEIGHRHYLPYLRRILHRSPAWRNAANYLGIRKVGR